MDNPHATIPKHSSWTSGTCTPQAALAAVSPCRTPCRCAVKWPHKWRELMSFNLFQTRQLGPRESSSTKRMNITDDGSQPNILEKRRKILGFISSMNQQWTSWRLGITTFIICCVWLEISHQTQLQSPPFQLSFPPCLVAFFSSVKDV